MSTDAPQVSRLRHACTFLLSGLLGALGLVAALQAGTPELLETDLPLLAVLAVMVPAYVAGNRYTLDFELRREAYAVTLVQLPLALGVLLVAPLVHLAARVVSAVIFVLAERQAPMKAAYNLGVASMEVGVAALAVSLVDTTGGPTYWLALYAGIVVGDVIGSLTLGAIWRLLGLPTGDHTTLRAVATTAPVALTFTAVAVVSVTALQAELWVAPVLLGLVAGLVLAYRAHRRIVTQQQATEQLYEFVKDLGPVDLGGEEVETVLQRIRLLLHSRQLDLTLLHAESWHHLRVSEDGALQRAVGESRPVSPPVTTTEPELVRRGQAGEADTMATPLRGNAGLSGILTATERLGAARGFDMRDLRLLETVGSELSTALERGRLLRDLGRAATTDSLTGLPNLAEVTTLLTGMLDRSRTGVVLAAVAVDSFREVNDTLGHEVGDELLLQVTQRLLAARPDAVVGRIGGGRFAIALERVEGQDPEMIGLALRAQVEGRAQLGAVGTHIKLSVGIAVSPEHGHQAATLIRRSETAMYSARHAHGGPVLWEPAYEVTGNRRLAVVTALREALSSGAIGVAYQPKISAASGDVTGVEALARWTHPALGAITPDEFIPLAEASGLMGPLTATILRQSLTACKGWQRRAGAVGVAVNVSADSVLDPSFITEVAGILASVGVDPGLLTLELTETVLLNDPALAATRIGELRSLGVKLSVDDFGTGYSSLTYLKGLPVDEVKIDKGFVSGLVDDPADRAVVRAVVDIAHTLGLRVVAEGVEHESQNGILRALGVDELQGFLHSRPMPALEVAAWLRQRELSARL